MLRAGRGDLDVAVAAGEVTALSAGQNAARHSAVAGRAPEEHVEERAACAGHCRVELDLKRIALAERRGNRILLDNLVRRGVRHGIRRRIGDSRGRIRHRPVAEGIGRGRRRVCRTIRVVLVVGHSVRARERVRAQRRSRGVIGIVGVRHRTAGIAVARIRNGVLIRRPRCRDRCIGCD